MKLLNQTAGVAMAKSNKIIGSQFLSQISLALLVNGDVDTLVIRKLYFPGMGLSLAFASLMQLLTRSEKYLASA